MISFAEAGEPGLLIVSVPAEFSASSQETDCFVIPVLSRSGGMLICVPRGVFSEDVLIDCLTGEDASHVIGPSKGVSVQLHEESEEAGVVPVPGAFNVMLVDVSDDALAWMRDYDASGDGLDAITSFSSEHPFAIPIASQLVPFAQEWVSSHGSDRVNFYSAQEEQDPVPTKKAAAKPAGKTKRIAEESHQCSGCRTDGDHDCPDESSVCQDRDFGASKDGWCKSCSRARRWRSSWSSLGIFRSSSLRWPSCNRLLQVHVAGGSSSKSQSSYSFGSSSSSKFNSGSSSGRGGSEWTCSSSVPAKHSCAGAGLALGQSERSSRRHPGGQCSFHFHQRSAKKGENATGPRYGVLGLLPPGYATVAQEALPVTAFAEDHRRAWPPFSPDLLGTQWRIQTTPRSWPPHVAFRPHGRRSCSRRSPSSSRKVGFNDGSTRTECGRWWRLDGCISSVIGGRSPDLPFPRSVEHYGTFWETVWEPGTPSMVIGRPCLYKRNGGLGEQEARIPQKESKDDRSRQSIAEKKGKISKASSSRSGCCEGTIDGSHEGIQKSGGNVPVAAGCRDKLHADAAGLRNDLFGKHISFASWCAQMVASVFRTRTSFSAFARSAIHLTRSTEVSRSPAFPIPLPHVGVFDRMPSGLSLHHRSQIHFKRAVVLTILALDFWWSGNRFIDLDLLRRSPSVSQRQIIKRVVDFMQVDGPKIPFSVSLSGRRSPQLIARLCELSDAGVKNSPYDRTFEGFESEVPVDNSILPGLEPYRSLDFSRLRVVGEGHFNPIPFLDDNLCMAFCNPDSLLHPVLPDKENLPCIRDPLEQIVGLMKLWDCRGLLLLHEHNTPGLYPHECVRIFNCFKSVGQIGDRRGRNFCERRLHGPSKLLPAGPDVFELFLEVGEQVHVSVSDRRDFYHQFSTTYSRAISNTLSPGVPAELVSDTAAFSALILRKANQSSSRHCVGDGLFASHRFPKVTKKRPSLVFGAFKSILQGDHGGVEFACQSHENLLRSGKLLGEDVRIVADRPFRGDSLMQGLVIDDFFAVSKVPRGTVGETPDVKMLKLSGKPSKSTTRRKSLAPLLKMCLVKGLQK